MARYYQTLAPARYQVREGVRGGWYIIDTNPGTYSRMEGTGVCFKDDSLLIFKGAKRDYWRTYEGARNTAQRLNQKG